MLNFKLIITFFIPLTLFSAEMNKEDLQTIDQLGKLGKRQIQLLERTNKRRFTSRNYGRNEYAQLRKGLLAPASILIEIATNKKVRSGEEIIVNIAPDQNYKNHLKILDKNLKPLYLVRSENIAIIDTIIDLDQRPATFSVFEKEQIRFIKPEYILYSSIKYQIDNYRIEPYTELFKSTAEELFSQKVKADVVIRGEIPIYFGLTSSLLHDGFNLGGDNKLNRTSFYIGPIVKTPNFQKWGLNAKLFLSFEHGLSEKIGSIAEIAMNLESDIMEFGFESNFQVFSQNFVLGGSYYRQWISYDGNQNLDIVAENNVFDGWSFFAGVQFMTNL